MTFLDPAHPLRHVGGFTRPLVRFRGIADAAERRRAGDEDEARKAFGNDPMMLSALHPGATLEHLARIALG